MERHVSASSWPHHLLKSLCASVLVQELMVGGTGPGRLGLGSSPACITDLGCDLEKPCSSSDLSFSHLYKEQGLLSQMLPFLVL